MIITAYFFTDEAEQLNGPYVCREEAELAGESYGAYLNDVKYLGSDAVLDIHRRNQDFRDQISAACHWTFTEKEKE